MTDHDVTRPVRFVDGRTLSHICQGRTQPRHDIWESHHGPQGGEDVSMVFCWSCLTLFVREGSREAYLAWVNPPSCRLQGNVHYHDHGGNTRTWHRVSACTPVPFAGDPVPDSVRP